jgi:hypothetical protein
LESGEIHDYSEALFPKKMGTQSVMAREEGIPPGNPAECGILVGMTGWLL